MDKSEKRFEYDIEQHLITHGYEQFVGQSADAPEGTRVWLHNRQHDIEKCIYMDVLCEFIAKTQPKEWAKYVKYYGDKATDKLYTRLEQVISTEGLIYVLRNGIEDLGVKLRVCYFQPESGLNETLNAQYAANILGCTRQFRYSPSKNDTIDMVLSVNGIPVVAIELKNQFKGQDVFCAMQQYRKDRSSKEFAFRLDHRFLVYFAVDLRQVYMTTQLKDDDTYFMPFNMGSGGAGATGGAGNPKNEHGYDTAYLWEQVLSRDSLMDILHRFIAHMWDAGRDRSPSKGRIIFPRYHQYDVVRKIAADVREKGPGTNYLIQHSAGSGKSNSIAWLAYRLASLHGSNDESIFDSVIVVTNRVVLDSQLQDTISSFECTAGLLECIDNEKKSRGLAEAINSHRRIIICTIQKFLFAYKDIEKSSGQKYAVIVDEAHQGQSGETAKTLRRSLINMGAAIKDYAEEEGIDESAVDLTNEYISAVLGQGKHENQSFFAFTATPKAESLELFGTEEKTPGGEILHRPFHVYSMRQAIEEGFILDVLKNYTTIQEAFQLVRISDDNPELIEGAASKALFKYYKQHGFTISQKTEMIMANFLENCRYQIGGRGKAMVVADSRANAVRYYLEIKKYLKEHPSESAGTDVMVAFSGEVALEDAPAEKPYTEASMNLDEKGNFITSDKQFRKAFHSSQYNILVVANKYQTGFDEPLLHSMYVDKKLKDITAVQTLSRLNRTAPGKGSTFVLDFENTEEEIRMSFLPFYEATAMEGSTDLNRVYDLRTKIAKFRLYDFKDVQTFTAFMESHSGKAQNPAALGTLAGLLHPIIDRYNALDEEEQDDFRDYIRKFNSAYSYITQLVRLHDRELFHEFQYTTNLARFLPRKGESQIDIDNKIKLEYAKLTETFSGQVVLNEKPPILAPDSSLQPKKPNKKQDTLQNIIDKINERFGGNFTEADRVIIESIYQMFMKDANIEKFRKFAQDNSPEMFSQSLFPDKFQEIVTQYYVDNSEAFQKLFSDPEFYRRVQEEMAQELYRSLRR